MYDPAAPRCKEAEKIGGRGGIRTHVQGVFVIIHSCLSVRLPTHTDTRIHLVVQALFCIFVQQSAKKLVRDCAVVRCLCAVEFCAESVRAVFPCQPRRNAALGLIACDGGPILQGKTNRLAVDLAAGFGRDFVTTGAHGPYSRNWNCSTGARRRRMTARDSPLRRGKTSNVNPKPFCQPTCPT